MMISCILDFLTKLYNCKIILQFFNKVAVLAQLGERQTEEFENFGQLKLSGGPVFDPQKSHFLITINALPTYINEKAHM